MIKRESDVYAFTMKRLVIIATPCMAVAALTWMIARRLSQTVAAARQCSRHSFTPDYIHCIAITNYIDCALLVLSAVVAVGFIGLVYALLAEFLTSQWGGLSAEKREMLVVGLDETIWWWIGVLATGIIAIFMIIELAL